MVGALVVDFNGDPPPVAFQNEVGIAAVLIDVVKVILGIEVSGLLGTEGLAEQLDEQVLGPAAGGGMIRLHPGHLNFHFSAVFNRPLMPSK